jgi:phage terminase small subunit
LANDLKEQSDIAFLEITAKMQSSFIEREISNLERYAFQLAVARDCEARVFSEGMIIADEKGRPVPHPCIQLLKSANAEIRNYAAIYKGKGIK